MFTLPSTLYDMTVGFEPFYDRMQQMAHSNKVSYPHYDILKRGEDQYVITIALAGFDQENISVEQVDRRLMIKAIMQEPDKDLEFIRKGISRRNVHLEFDLGQNVEVAGESVYHNGLLAISLERQIPEQMKPKKIPISSSATSFITSN